MNIPIPDSERLKAQLSLSGELRFVATGGFKAVFKHERPDTITEAIKAVYFPKATTDEGSLLREQLLARAKREIASLEKCSHPSIVNLGTLLPVELEADDHDYLVYSEEFLPGRSLASWLDSEEPVPFEKLQGVLLALADAIQCLSSHGYLHRDIKPDNIIETDDPNRPYVVLDMGIAYKHDGTELTNGGGPPGTIRYMPPELLRPDYKDIMDFRCDLYSAGLTIYVLATKSHPFAPKPEAAFATAYRIMKTSPTPLHELRKDLPEAFCQIIDRCIRKKPALRYGNLNGLRTEIEAIAR